MRRSLSARFSTRRPSKGSSLESQRHAFVPPERPTDPSASPQVRASVPEPPTGWLTVAVSSGSRPAAAWPRSPVAPFAFLLAPLLVGTPFGLPALLTFFTASQPASLAHRRPCFAAHLSAVPPLASLPPWPRSLAFLPRLLTVVTFHAQRPAFQRTELICFSF